MDDIQDMKNGQIHALILTCATILAILEKRDESLGLTEAQRPWAKIPSNMKLAVRGKDALYDMGFLNSLDVMEKHIGQALKIIEQES